MRLPGSNPATVLTILIIRLFGVLRSGQLLVRLIIWQLRPRGVLGELFLDLHLLLVRGMYLDLLLFLLFECFNLVLI